MKIEWNKVTWHSKLLAVVLSLVIFALGFCFGIQYQEVLDSQNVAEKLSVLVPHDTDPDVSKLETYSDPALHVSFQYPETWGPVVVHHDGDYGYFLLFSNLRATSTSAIFLSAIDPRIEPLGRGGFWGDAATNVTSQDFIKHYCDKKTQCDVQPNKTGLLIAREKEFACSEGGCTSDQTQQYYFYNPYSRYRGFVLSDSRLGDSYSNSNADAFASLVESIKVIDPASSDKQSTYDVFGDIVPWRTIEESAPVEGISQCTDGTTANVRSRALLANFGGVTGETDRDIPTIAAQVKTNLLKAGWKQCTLTKNSGANEYSNIGTWLRTTYIKDGRLLQLNSSNSMGEGASIDILFEYSN